MARTGSGRNEDALSEIVGFVLILALVVVASTLYLLYVVPAEGREDEIEHMNQVQDRFVSYKTSVDGLWMRAIGAAYGSQGTEGVSLSTSFDLGTGGGNTQSSGIFLSFMRPIGTAARMKIASENGDRDRITFAVYEDAEGEPEEGEGFENLVLGQLGYETDNYYWIQQRYEYSAGGVFLEQVNEGVSVKAAPGIAVYGRALEDQPDRQIAKIRLCLVNPTGVDAVSGGTGPLRVETRLRENFERIEHQLNDPKQYERVQVHVEARNEWWGDAWEHIFRSAVPPASLTDGWCTIERSGDENHPFVDLNIYDPDTTDQYGVEYDMLLASLQVTFEYAES